MKQLQMSLAWFLAFLLVSANVGLEGCSAKDSPPGAAVQPSDAASAPAANATNASLATPAAPAQQTDQSQQQPPQAQLPAVNLTAEALLKAAEDGNQDEMMAVLGDDGKDLVYSGDPVQDKSGMENFVKSYKTKHAIVAQDSKTRVLRVGASDWELPIPIVNEGGQWRFDTAAGREELLYRRIGHNELGAIAACRGYIDAQKDYASVGHDGLPAGIYAQRFLSSPGKQDGLYWETAEDEPASPAGPLLAQASDEGYGTGVKGQPYHGYLYRVLKAQGAAAKGGAKSYLTDGKLTEGVALVAFPAQYKVSGVMTFIINQRGIVYQKDLGEKTLEIAGAMTEYNPDNTWKKVTD